MLDRVTPRPQLRDELISITRMLLGLDPAIAGELPAPEAEADTEAEPKAAAKATPPEKAAESSAKPAAKKNEPPAPTPS